MPKQIISMNVDSNVYSKYAKICRNKGIIMSKQIENYMKRFLEEENE
ncbi:MAG: hypothetical protein ABIJ08_06675 [Nanoarchaeota archaeon]